MQYLVRIIDHEEKNIDVHLEEKDVPRFLECVKKGDVAWNNDDKDTGFYIDPKSVRFMQLAKIKDQPQKEEEAPENEQ